MKRLQQVSMAGIILASIAAGTNSELTSVSSPRRANPNVHASRKSDTAVYQQRLSVLAAMVESDQTILELQLTKLANS